MLLDTQVVLWLLLGHQRLGAIARRSILEAGAVHVSAASLWEIAIKRHHGKLVVPDNLVELIGEAGLQPLEVSAAHAWTVQEVRLPHGDPFDALLLAQATVERLGFVTADRLLLQAESSVVRLDARL